MTETKREILQKLLDSLTGEDAIYGEWYLEFRGRGGWWVNADDSRYIGDNGEYLGQDWRDAKQGIKQLFPLPNSVIRNKN